MGSTLGNSLSFSFSISYFFEHKMLDFSKFSFKSTRIGCGSFKIFRIMFASEPELEIELLIISRFYIDLSK
jgi:hypothetical protein